jgi:hypothetical protein
MFHGSQKFASSIGRLLYRPQAQTLGIKREIESDRPFNEAQSGSILLTIAGKHLHLP